MSESQMVDVDALAETIWYVLFVAEYINDNTDQGRGLAETLIADIIRAHLIKEVPPK